MGLGVWGSGVLVVGPFRVFKLGSRRSGYLLTCLDLPMLRLPPRPRTCPSFSSLISCTTVLLVVPLAAIIASDRTFDNCTK